MHFNITDLLIILLCCGALYRGYQIGLIRQVSSTIAFIVGIYPGSLLSSLVMTHVAGPDRPLAGLAVLLSVCLVLMTIGELIAIRLKVAVRNRVIQLLDDSTGAVMSVITLLLGVWLAAALFTLAPVNKLQNEIKDSAVLSELNNHLPPATQVLTALNKLIDPSQSPQVFSGREPSTNTSYKLPNPASYSQALSRVQASVVKLEGFGCGGIVDGSGFSFAPGYVATNAHVVAGVQSPKVRQAKNIFNTTVVLFDPSNDIAVLRVNGLTVPALTLQSDSASQGTPAFALGYPGGGNYTATPSVVLDQFYALGQDIYGTKHTTRRVYAIQAAIIKGNSGGPLVDTHGNVIGVVFATSTTYNNVGYALTTAQVMSELQGARTATAAVGTGQCSE